MLDRLKALGMVIVSFPLAYFGGNVIVSELASATWITPLLALVMKPAAFEIGFYVSLWLVRGAILLVMLAMFLPAVIFGPVTNDKTP